jgi:transmembrane sensor
MRALAAFVIDGRDNAVDADGVAAWRRGRLMFQDRPLGEVVAALNRYHRGLFWAAPSIRGRRVSGVFSTAKPLDAIRAIELSLGLNATYVSDYLVLLRG